MQVSTLNHTGCVYYREPPSYWVCPITGSPPHTGCVLLQGAPLGVSYYREPPPPPLILGVLLQGAPLILGVS
jgi:hypothetical protein